MDFSETLEVTDEDDVTTEYSELAKIDYRKFRQIISNEVFNNESAQSFTQSTVKHWNTSGTTGYFFELLDEAHKQNEAENMVFELEKYFGLFKVTKDSNGEISISQN